jgi:hypothetical protein
VRALEEVEERQRALREEVRQEKEEEKEVLMTVRVETAVLFKKNKALLIPFLHLHSGRLADAFFKATHNKYLSGERKLSGI